MCLKCYSLFHGSLYVSVWRRELSPTSCACLPKPAGKGYLVAKAFRAEHSQWARGADILKESLHLTQKPTALQMCSSSTLSLNTLNIQELGKSDDTGVTHGQREEMKWPEKEKPKGRNDDQAFHPNHESRLQRKGSTSMSQNSSIPVSERVCNDVLDQHHQ